jgi:putative flavoprotein involved in K+ transport
MPASTIRIHTIVIGGGQAGLSVGYYLKKLGVPFLILDAHDRIGDSWRRRWDSLRLFSPARYCGLPGMKVPGRGDAFLAKDELADYLETYADHFELPIRTGTRVDRVWKKAGKFMVAAGGSTFECDQVVVAMSNYQQPRIPAFAQELDPAVRQLHSHSYRNPAQLKDGDVLVVGAGNSGADIALELADSHTTWLSGTESGHLPFRIETALCRFFVVRVVRFVGHHVLSLRTPFGRKARPRMLHRAAPLIRVKPRDLTDRGVKRVPRVAGVSEGRPVLADGQTLNVNNVIWCTGYQPGFSWIDLPVQYDDSDYPMNERGIPSRSPGLYFVGLHFQYSMTSATLTGIGRDAKYIAETIASQPARGFDEEDDKEAATWMQLSSR